MRRVGRRYRNLVWIRDLTGGDRTRFRRQVGADATTLLGIASERTQTFPELTGKLPLQCDDSPLIELIGRPPTAASTRLVRACSPFALPRENLVVRAQRVVNPVSFRRVLSQSRPSPRGSTSADVRRSDSRVS